VDSVALAATIGGSLVGLAGVGVSAWSNWLQQGTARDLAATQHEHERELARGARLYERRAPIYETTLNFLNLWMERVDMTERLWTSENDPDPPQLPNAEEWRMMLTRLGVHGSPAASDAYRAFADSITAFYERVKELRMLRAGHAEGSADDAATRMMEARADVREALLRLTRILSDELAAL
jgi:hypothetical protein